MTDVSAQQQPLDHESSYYTQIMDHPMVQQARSTYDWAKQQNSYLGSTLDSVEQRASGAVQAVHRKYSETYENYYVRPKEAVYENGKWVLENGKNAAIHTGTMALGASVLATQLALQITIGSANLVLDGAGAVVSAGKGVVTSVRQTEHAVEEKIWTAIAEAQRMAKVPVDKTAEMTHSFLDIVNALVERTLHVNIQNEPETSVKDRVKNLAQAVVSGLTARAHEQVIDPVQERTHTLLENLSKSFVLVDVVRSKKEWALEKYEELSSSVSDLKVRLENEAKQYGARPEEMLMRFIRNRSQLLKEQLQSLKSKQQEMFGNGNRLEDTISYLQGLDNQLREANDIYKVRDEVLTEARQRLAELTQWTSGLLNGQTVVEN